MASVREDDGYFDERVAASYDEFAAEMFDPEGVGAAIYLLGEPPGSGRALELGIGTGWIALPLVDSRAHVSVWEKAAR